MASSPARDLRRWRTLREAARGRGYRSPPRTGEIRQRGGGKTHQITLMYYLAGDRHRGTWREFTAAVSAAGGAPVAVAAAERAGPRRSARGRALRAGGPAPEPGLLPPAPAARRWPCLDAAQRRRRP